MPFRVKQSERQGQQTAQEKHESEGMNSHQANNDHSSQQTANSMPMQDKMQKGKMVSSKKASTFEEAPGDDQLPPQLFDRSGLHVMHAIQAIHPDGGVKVLLSQTNLSATDGYSNEPE